MTTTSRKSFMTGLLFTAAASMLSMGCGSDDEMSGTIKEDVSLTTAMEVPAPMGTTSASGSFRYEMAEATGMMTYTLTVAGLTGPATGAHIHKAPPGMSGPVVLPLMIPTTGSMVTGTVTLDPTMMTDLKAGNLYVNVHTAANAAGEIRGQLTGK